ncbi:peptidase S8, partial [Mycolicibacterium insubricum]|nr:peptidase S8 [Mycolicibacterium insubricum]
MGADALTPARSDRAPRAAALAATLLLALGANIVVAQAIPAPAVDPAQVPADQQPGPEEPMRQSNRCAEPITVAEPDAGTTAPGFTTLNIAEAWRYSTGTGVPVAVIDTGVNPSPRLPVPPRRRSSS